MGGGGICPSLEIVRSTSLPKGFACIAIYPFVWRGGRKKKVVRFPGARRLRPGRQHVNLPCIAAAPSVSFVKGGRAEFNRSTGTMNYSSRSFLNLRRVYIAGETRMGLNMSKRSLAHNFSGLRHKSRIAPAGTRRRIASCSTWLDACRQKFCPA